MTQIFCPKCHWLPRKNDKWHCEPGCGHAWHTFDTRGQCPRCLKQWRQTQCWRCTEFSAHDSWYHEDPEELARLNRLADTEPVRA